MRGRRGFTMIDVVVLGLVGMLLLGVGMCTGGRSRETAGRIRCSSNLRQIGLAMIMYANDNNNRFPRARWDDGATPTAYTAPTAGNPFLDDGPAPNDITAIPFLLLRTQDITSDVFICATTARQPWQGRPLQASNFSGEQNLSYSFHNGYADSIAVEAGARWNDALGSDFAIAADMNPGTPAVTVVLPTSPMAQQREANSFNHLGDGQNVLYADSHVEWYSTVFAGAPRTTGPGAPRDNVFKASDIQQNAQGGGVIWASPVDGNDSVLLPVATSSPHAAASSLSWNWIVGGIAVIVIVVVFFLLRRLDRVPPEAEA